MAGELEGVAVLARRLKSLGKAAAGQGLKDAARAGLKPALAIAKTSVPKGSVPHKTYKGRLVGPGFASRSLRLIVKLKAQGTAAEAILGVRSEAYYVLQFIERGTSKYPAHPWLGPAQRRGESAGLIQLGASLKKSIDKAAKA